MKPQNLACQTLILLGLTALASCEKKPALPPLPVKVSTRNANALTNWNKVAHFENTSAKTLSIAATFKNAAFSDQKKFNIVLRPSEYAEIGWMEGWDLLPGETITLESPGYQSWTVRIPE